MFFRLSNEKTTEEKIVNGSWKYCKLYNVKVGDKMMKTNYLMRASGGDVY